MTDTLTTEYRFVTQRPASQEGRGAFYWPKRSLDAAERALASHNRDQEWLAAGLGLEPWEGWIETRDVTPWTRLDEGNTDA